MRTSEYESLSEELDGEISLLQGTGEDGSMLGRGTTQERRTQVDRKPGSLVGKKVATVWLLLCDAHFSYLETLHLDSSSLSQGRTRYV